MAQGQNNSAKTISTVMLLTLLGKALGLYRDRLLAVHYGSEMAANAFYTASRLPRVFFDVIFASAIAACFIPVFSEYLTKKGKEEAMGFAGCFLTIVGCLTAVLSLLGALFAKPLVGLVADGFDEPTMALAVELTRIMFPAVFFTGIAFCFVGILQSMNHFKVPALISALSNIVIIAYFFVLDKQFGIYGLAAAFLVGWLVQALVQVPTLGRLGFRYRPSLRGGAEGMRKVFALMLPVMISTWVQPINLTIHSRFGSHLYGGAGVTALELSSGLYLMIAGVFILSVTNVIFPRLSRLSAQGETGEFQSTVRQTVHSTLFFILPMSMGLMVVAQPLVSLLYGDGKFDAFSVLITARALRWAAPGMVGFALHNILSRVYFARQKGRAPLLAGAVSIGVNIALCVVLIEPLEITGLAIASAVSATVYGLLLLVPIQRGGDRVFDGRFALDLVKMLVTTLFMGWVAALVLDKLGVWLPPGKLSELIALAVCAGVGGALYLLATGLLGLQEARLALRLLRGKRAED